MFCRKAYPAPLRNQKNTTNLRPSPLYHSSAGRNLKQIPGKVRSMSRNNIHFEKVRKLGLTFPGVEEGTAYGSPALKVRGKLMACLPAHRSAEPASLVVCVDRADRAELLTAAPDLYYVTNHYVDYDSVLVRLSRIPPDALKDLLGMAYKFVSAKAKKRSRSHARPAGNA
jgi:hypothetical protein